MLKSEQEVAQAGISSSPVTSAFQRAAACPASAQPQRAAPDLQGAGQAQLGLCALRKAGAQRPGDAGRVQPAPVLVAVDDDGGQQQDVQRPVLVPLAALSLQVSLHAGPSLRASSRAALARFAWRKRAPSIHPDVAAWLHAALPEVSYKSVQTYLCADSATGWPPCRHVTCGTAQSACLQQVVLRVKVVVPHAHGDCCRVQADGACLLLCAGRIAKAPGRHGAALGVAGGKAPPQPARASGNPPTLVTEASRLHPRDAQSWGMIKALCTGQQPHRLPTHGSEGWSTCLPRLCSTCSKGMQGAGRQALGGRAPGGLHLPGQPGDAQLALVLDDQLCSGQPLSTWLGRQKRVHERWRTGRMTAGGQ